MRIGSVGSWSRAGRAAGSGNDVEPRCRARLAGALLGAAAALSGVSGGAAAQTVFIDRLADVPLMPGLTLTKNGGLAFDTPSGRIVEVVTTGKVTRAQVLRFYRRSLGNLGWRGVGTRFDREGEALRLRFEAGPKSDGGRLNVRFTLTPKS